MRLGNLSAVHPYVHSAGYRGHDHFWERALSRRRFLGATVAGAGAIAASGVLSPVLAAAKGGGGAAPRPIDYGFTAQGTTFHFSLLDTNSELGVIRDFMGNVGAADIQGGGTGFLPGHQPERLLYDSDMRYMQGRYVGQDGDTHHGTFVFV